MQVRTGERSGGHTAGEPSWLLCGRAPARTRGASARQLPTNSDPEGGRVPIPEYQTDQPSTQLPRPQPGAHLAPNTEETI